MATKAFAVDNLARKYGKNVVAGSWTLASGDTGAMLEEGDKADCSVQIEGTMSGTTIAIQGSNDGSNWHTLLDANGNAMSYTSSGVIVQVGQVTRYMQPVATGGTGTGLVVTLFKRANSSASY